MSTALRKRLFGWGAVLASAALIAGCAGSSEPAPEPEAIEETTTETETAEVEENAVPEVSEINFGILPIPGYAPIKLALDEGLFEEEGLSVTLEVMAPGTAVSSIVGGSLQFAGQNWIAVMGAIGQGVGLVPVAELERGTPGYAEFLVRADSEFQTLEDLDGAKFGVVATPGNCDLIAQATLQAQGSDVTPQYVNIAVPDMPGTLERGDIDVACVPEPTLSAMKASGAFRSVFDLFAGDYVDFPVSGVFASAEFANANPNTVAAVQRALARANEMIQADEQLVRDIVPEYTPVPAEAANVMTLPFYPVTDFKALMAAVTLVEESGLASGLEIAGVTD